MYSLQPTIFHEAFRFSCIVVRSADALEKISLRIFRWQLNKFASASTYLPSRDKSLWFEGISLAQLQSKSSASGMSSISERKSILSEYFKLPQGEKCQVNYIWIDGTGQQMRSKSRTFPKVPSKVEDVPNWSFCGFGTYMSDSARDSEMILVPVAMYPDPFRRGNNKLVLCETFEAKDDKLEPTDSNHRHKCKEVLKKAESEQPWFGIEQEYMLFDKDGQPLGWPKSGFPAPMGPYYCGVGTGKAIYREIVEAHYRCMLYCGVEIYGENAEAMPSQWEFQLGPTQGIEACDELWLGRYLLHRVAEDFDVIISFDPKPISGNWNGAGGHFNFSTKAMRGKNGLKAIEKAVEQLSKSHKSHIRVYDPNGGEDNKRRLTGKNETASIKTFSSAVGDKTVSVRIPKDVAKDGKGYLEDRRPAANCDPYAVATALVETICLGITDDKRDDSDAERD